MASTKRRLIPGNIELHPTECALVVNYSIIEPNQQDPSPATKTIAIKSLSPTTDLASLAVDVAAKCKLIHPNKVPKVEQLLATLVQRHAPLRKPASTSSLSSSTSTATSNRTSPRGGNATTGSSLSVAEAFDGRWDTTDEDASAPPTSSSSPTPAASLDLLDQYLELLYEDLPSKLDSTRALLSLSLTPAHLPLLAANDSLLPALARTLREDTKRSMHLSASILAIFHQFALHDEFRPLLSANKVGDLCLRQLEMEVHRTQVLAKEEEAAAPAGGAGGGSGWAAVRARQDAVIYEAASVLVQLADETAKGVQAKMVKRGVVHMLVALLKPGSGAGSRGGARHPAVTLLLLHFLTSLTRFRETVQGLAIDGDGAAGLIDTLVTYAAGGVGGGGGGGAAIQAEALRVMLNLSHDADWRAEMMRVNLVARLAAVLKEVGGAADESQGGGAGWVSELLLVMYQLSCDERSRAVFTYTEAMPLIRKMVLKSAPDMPLSVELMTLAINLALNEHNAEQFADHGGLKQLMKRLTRSRDYLLLKLVRNLSLHPSLHLMFVDHLDDLLSTFLPPASSPPTSASTDLMVELIGTLANLRHPSIDFAHVLATYPSLLPLLTSTLLALRPNDTLTLTPARAPMRGATSDDLSLESIQLLTTLALDADTSRELAAADVPRVLLGVMRAREDDDEMVLQVLLAMAHLLMAKHTRDVLLPPRDTGAKGAGEGGGGAPGPGSLVAYLIDLMYDRNAAIRGACLRCLDVVCDLAEAEAEAEAEVAEQEHEAKQGAEGGREGGGGGGAVRAWAEYIRTERFHYHNAEWLAAMASAGASAGLHMRHATVVGQQQQQPPRGETSEDDEDDEEDLSLAIRLGKRSPKHVDHDDGNEHHAADMFGHVKLVYA